MGPTDEVNVIFLEELLDNRLSKSVRDSSVVLSPAGLALLRIRPKQIAQKTILGHLGRSCDLLKLGNGDELWG